MLWHPGIALCLLVASPPSGAPAQAAADALVKEGQTLLQQGDVETAVQRFKAAADANPQLYPAHYELGRALDLQGQYAAARGELQHAIELAPEASKNESLTAMAISFAFEAKADEAARYYQRVYDAAMQANDPPAAAATANALGRVFLESGRLDKAAQWYRTGYETSKRLSQRPREQQTLWELRWEHALGRIAARRHRRAEALQHAAAVRRLLARGLNRDQQPIYPYLLGYIDFHTKRYRDAIARLAKGDQNDVFVLGLIAQSYDKLGDKDNARDYFSRVVASSAHSINMAFSRPKAQAFLRSSPR
jgi:tetratricopeptide (TPR) repeat protein